MDIKSIKFNKLKENKNYKVIILLIMFILTSTSIISIGDVLNKKDVLIKNYYESSMFYDGFSSVVNNVIYLGKEIDDEDINAKSEELNNKLSEELSDIDSEYYIQIENARTSNNIELEKSILEEKNKEIEETKTKYTKTDEEIRSVVLDEINKEKQSKKGFLRGEDNVKYIVVNEYTKEIYTNTSYKSLSGFTNKFNNYPYFLQLYGFNQSYKLEINNKKVTDPNVYGRISDSMYSGGYENVNAYFAIPSKIKYGDSIYHSYKNYNDIKMELIIEIAIFLISTIALIFLYREYKKVRENKNDIEEKYFNIYNKIPLEINLFSILLALGIQLDIIYDVKNLSIIPILLGAILILLLYSFSVYIKETNNKNDVIENSITGKILNPIIQSYLIKSIGQKWFITFAIFVLFQFGIIFIMAVAMGQGFYILLAYSGITFMLNFIFYLYTTRKLAYLNKIIIGTEQITRGDTNYKIEVIDKSSLGELAENINNIKQGLNRALENEMKSERMKSELITNVSHDLKTPLTSIINYVNILKSEDLKPDHVKDYVNILDKKSQRLRILIEDLFEASKATSGAMELQISKVEVTQLLRQSLAEMEEKINDSTLDFKVNMPNEKIYIMADGRKLWRVFENLVSNILKYSLKNTRVYIDVTQKDDNIYISMKNISTYELNFDPKEITERFKRGDESRNTEGSGLGLAIAKSLVELQGGKFHIEIDGDLFKVTLILKSI